MTNLTAEQIELSLSGFIGTEAYHRFNALCPKVVLTDGAKYLADQAEAYWLMDIIGSVYTAHQNRKQLGGRIFNLDAERGWESCGCESNRWKR